MHRPGCLVIVKYPKDHPRGWLDGYVQRRAGRVRQLPWLPLDLASGESLDSQSGEIAYHKEVEIFDDKLPFVDPSCMPDRQGFSDKDIEALHKPNNRQVLSLWQRTSTTAS
jgi:hypothetical protein